ncbi:hypothetical protein M569_03628, partial [Genlisea aurea]
IIPDGDRADPLYLSGSDHPNASLVSELLTTRNYFTWRRGVRLALGAKNKLGMIDGDLPKPEQNHPTFSQWVRTDYMIISWLLNSISKDLVGGFSGCNSSRELWLTLEAHYGLMNNNLLYQVQFDLYNLRQEEKSVAEYYTKINALWKDLETLYPEIKCRNCRSVVGTDEIFGCTKLPQFLIGLHHKYDGVKNQILAMDEGITVAKAYSMLLNVEQQM